MTRSLSLVALLLVGCPEEFATDPARPCERVVEYRPWVGEHYGADPTTGVCWLRVDRSGVPVPCARILSRPEFATVRDCPAFKTTLPTETRP
jgi:hypothetical protein